MGFAVRSVTGQPNKPITLEKSVRWHWHIRLLREPRQRIGVGTFSRNAAPLWLTGLPSQPQRHQRTSFKAISSAHKPTDMAHSARPTGWPLLYSVTQTAVVDSTQVARTFKATPLGGGSTQVRSASGSAHGCRPLGDGCQCPHPCSARFERIVAPAAVPLPALAVSGLRQLTPVSVAPTQRRARKQ